MPLLNTVDNNSGICHCQQCCNYIFSLNHTYRTATQFCSILIVIVKENIDTALEVFSQYWQFRWSGCLLRRSYHLFIASSISASTDSSWSMWRPVGMWCDAALSRTVRKIFSSLWQYVGRECLLRVVSTSCLYPSQLSFFRLTYVRRRPGLEGVFICNLMRIGIWSGLSVNNVCQEHAVMREADANETSGELGSAFGRTLVGLPQFRIP